MNKKDFFNRIVVHKQHLKNVAYHFTKDKHEIEDLVQETFCKALSASERYEDRGLKTWLTMILKNTFLNRMSKVKGVSFFDIEDNKDKNKDFNSGVNALEEKNVNDIITSVIGKGGLGKKGNTLYEDAFRLYMEEQSYEEISNSLNVPVSTVKIYLNRARTALKEFYNRANEKTSRRGAMI